jgi:hypothetical protein
MKSGTPEVSNLHKHALQEFMAARWLDGNGKYSDEMQQAICEHVLKLIDVFADEGHSGSSAPYAVNLFSKLAMFEPVAPLTGEDWEWMEVGEGVFQNKRCSRVFKQADRFDGQAYDINGIVFFDWHERELYEDEEGYPGTTRFKTHFTSRESMVPVVFPYTPVTVYQESVPEE